MRPHKQGFFPGIGDDEYITEEEEKGAQTKEAENIGTIASPQAFSRHTIRYPQGWRAINDW